MPAEKFENPWPTESEYIQLSLATFAMLVQIE
jgi:hypothetical protein